MRWYDIALAILVVFIWGVNFVAIKISVHEFPALFTLVLRFMLVTLITLPWIFRMKMKDVPGLLLLAAVNCVAYMGILFIGMQDVSANETVILIQLQVPISVVLAHFFFKDRLNFRMVIGIVIAFVGVVVTIGIPDRVGTAEGVGLVVISAFFWGVASLLMRKLKHIHPMTLNGSQTMFAILPMYLLCLLENPDATRSLLSASWEGYGAVIFTSVFSSVIAYTIWMYLLGKYRVNQITPFTLIEPAFGVAAGVLILNEAFFPHMAIGAVICAVGLYLVVRDKRAAKTLESVEAELPA